MKKLIATVAILAASTVTAAPLEGDSGTWVRDQYGKWHICFKLTEETDSEQCYPVPTKVTNGLVT